MCFQWKTKFKEVSKLSSKEHQEKVHGGGIQVELGGENPCCQLASIDS